MLARSGIKRFPYIGSVFNGVKAKKEALAALDQDHAMLAMTSTIVERMATKSRSPFMDEKDAKRSMPLGKVAEELRKNAGMEHVTESLLRLAIEDKRRVPQHIISAKHLSAESIEHTAKEKEAEGERYGESAAATEADGWVVQQVPGARDLLDKYYNERRRVQLPKYLPPFDYLKDCPMAISKGEQAKLDAELVARLCDLEPSRENKQEVDHLVALICRLGRKANPKGKVYASLFGSRVYNMCTNSSDVDIMVTVRVPDKNPEVAYTRFFNRLAYAMRCHRKFELVVKVSHARVPIIKFTYRCHSGQVLDGDISLNGSMGAAKSKLIATYVDMDPRVRQVLLVLKLWGKARGITDHNTLNSYGLMMMGIAFLISRRVVPPLQLVNTAVINQAGWKRLARIQSNADEVHSLYGASIADATSERGSGSVIQCIQTRNPLPDWRVDGKRAYFLGGKFISEWKSPNKHSAPKLLYEFFRYYGCEFDPMRNVVSPRLGSAGIPRSWLYELQVPEPAMYLSLPTQWRSDLRLLAIEDPFELSVNCARNATPEWCEGLFWEMRRAAWALQPRPGGFGGIQRLLLEPSQDTFGDASVWATAYHRLLPLLQNLVEEQVFDAKKDVRPASIIDMGELENTELAKASDGQKEAAPDAE